MTATQHIQLYNFFKQYLNVKDDAEVKVFVEQVERIVEDKFEKEKNNFSPKSDMEGIRYEINMLRQEMKVSNAELKIGVEKRLNQIILWIVSTGIAVIGLIIAFIKFTQ